MPGMPSPVQVPVTSDPFKTVGGKTTSPIDTVAVNGIISVGGCEVSFTEALQSKVPKLSMVAGTSVSVQVRTPPAGTPGGLLLQTFGLGKVCRPALNVLDMIMEYMGSA